MCACVPASVHSSNRLSRMDDTENTHQSSAPNVDVFAAPSLKNELVLAALFLCVCMCVHECACVCMCVHVCACVCMCACVHMCVYVDFCCVLKMRTATTRWTVHTHILKIHPLTPPKACTATQACNIKRTLSASETVTHLSADRVISVHAFLQTFSTLEKRRNTKYRKDRRVTEMRWKVHICF